MLVNLLDRRPAEALSAAGRATNPVFRLTGEAISLEALGRKGEAQATIDALISGWSHGAAYQLAQIHAWRGEQGTALDWLERAVSQRDGGLVIVKVDPLLRPLHGSARYAAVLRAMHLSPP